MGSASISVSELRLRIASSDPPIIVDVRRASAFRDSTDLVSGALRREPESIGGWAKSLPAASAIVVYCVRGGEVSQEAAKALAAFGIAASYVEGGLEAWKSSGGALDRKPRAASTRWVTRERPKIDRIACPWLIARFIDAQAEFIYVPRDRVLAAAEEKEAAPYDIPGAHFGHEGDRCSFDAFLAHYRLRDPALDRLAVIVRGADTGKPELSAQAPGLLAISQGLSRNFQDDHEMLKHGMVMYDALYAWCREQARA